METLLIIIVIYGMYHFVIGSIVYVHHASLWDMRIYQLKSQLLDIQIKNPSDGKLFIYKHIDGLLDFLSEHKGQLNVFFIRAVAVKLDKSNGTKIKSVRNRIESSNHVELKAVLGATKRLMGKIFFSNLLRWPITTVLVVVPVIIYAYIIQHKNLKQTKNERIEKLAMAPNEDLERFAGRFAFL